MNAACDTGSTQSVGKPGAELFRLSIACGNARVHVFELIMYIHYTEGFVHLQRISDSSQVSVCQNTLFHIGPHRCVLTYYHKLQEGNNICFSPAGQTL